MGSYLSTNRANAEESDNQTSSGAYRFPPKSGGSYFSNHFIMGGEKFDTPQPEAFLFGDNTDLNFLGPKAAPFPYPPPSASEATKTLRSLINIRRDSVHIVPVPGQTPIPSCPTYDSDADEYQQQRVCDESQRIWALHRERKYNLQFTFDSDVRCAITVYYFCTEEISPVTASYTPIAEGGTKSETFYYKRGSSQVFNQPSHIIQPGKFKDSDLAFRENDDGSTFIPVAIQCVALDGESPRQAHTTVAAFERTHEGAYVLKNIKQKLFVDGLSYLLQEIYGLENKSADLPNKNNQFDDDFDDCGADCVVCMCDLRDTIILPCRHLCLCYACAESLRYQASNCPICRAPFIALLQIRAVQKMSHNTHPALAGTEPTAQEGVPPGYTSISLVEALNGPCNNRDRESTPLPVNSASSANNAATTSEAATSEATSGNSGATAAAAATTSSSSTSSRFAHGKKARTRRRGSKDQRTHGPRNSASMSSQLSSNSPLNEEPENGENNSVISEVSHDAVPSASAVSATAAAAVANVPPVKVKSADTNVRVSLKIVNEVESGKKALDIVEEELAKMAVAESLNDLPNEIDTTRIQDIDAEDLEDEDDSTDDDEAGEEGDDEEDEEDCITDDAVVVTLPMAAVKNPSEPGTPMSHTSERSSQNSAASSAGSTKQLLPCKAGSMSEGKTTPVQHESKIVMVASSKVDVDDDDDDNDAEENEDFC